MYCVPVGAEGGGLRFWNPQITAANADILWKSWNQLFYVTYTLADKTHRTRIVTGTLEFVKIDEELKMT